MKCHLTNTDLGVKHIYILKQKTFQIFRTCPTFQLSKHYILLFCQYHVSVGQGTSFATMRYAHHLFKGIYCNSLKAILP